MNTTLVINRKGGAGKTTVATNLASYFASNNVATALMDYDPQGSSLNWLKLRPAHLAKIHGANAAPQRFGTMRGFAMYLPPDTRQLIIDAPAGVTGVPLQEMVRRATSILIPVTPSTIDCHATADFIRDLLLTGIIRGRNIRMAVVANRVRRSMPVYQPLERFLHALNLDLVGRLLDSDAFLKAAEAGVGIFEMDDGLSVAERKQFAPIAEWVDGKNVRRDEPPPSNVRPFSLATRSTFTAAPAARYTARID